jgi:energy coupling factor transporter S component ThiW
MSRTESEAPTDAGNCSGPNSFGRAPRRLKRSRRIVVSALMVALGVALSIYPGSIPLGPTRVFPFQHMINAICGIFLGPVDAVLIALAIGMVRIGIGTGTVFAVSGGVPGALVVGLVYGYLLRKDVVALTEPVGTLLGALISALLVAPLTGNAPFPAFAGMTAQWQLFSVFFLMSSLPGAVLGFLATKALRRSNVLANI